MKEIIKRDGRKVKYNLQKIEIAIGKAMKSVECFDEKKLHKVVSEIDKELNKKYFDKELNPTIENIQDIAERHLILNKLTSVAKAYILYRDLHTRMRKFENLFDVGTWINTYINKKNWKTHADDQIDYHLQGLYKNITNEASEIYWMNEVFDDEMRGLHQAGDLKIHKVTAISPYCVGWDLYDLICVGFQGVSGNVTSAPPKHLASALGQLVNFMYTLTNETPDGAVAISSFDTLLAPFVKYDKLTYKEVEQNVQEFVYNMNVPTKSGGQVVFSNITLDLVCPSHLKNESVVIGGIPQKEKYGDFAKEMDMINSALTSVYTKGDARGRVFTWPIPTYNITKDFNWDNKNISGIWEMTAKYGVPYFANFINSDMSPDDARSMCCRLRIDNRELRKRGGGLFGSNPLTGSIGYLTINLPRLGYLYKGNKRQLYKRLNYLLKISHKILMKRREVCENFADKGLYPYSAFYLRNVKKKTGKYWINHFNTIGIIGMNECCLNYMNKDLHTEEGQNFAKEMLDFINGKLKEFQLKTGILYNLEASPAESTSYELALKDKKIYPDIIVANEENYQKGAEPYYTNSTHLSVKYTDDLFDALDHQDELQSRYTGGTVFHVFLGERINSGEQAKLLVRKIAENYKLPYFTITPTFSICDSHGYLRGGHFKCPECNEECKVYSRVVGKISPIQRWNPGKKEEFKDRKTYSV